MGESKMDRRSLIRRGLLVAGACFVGEGLLRPLSALGEEFKLVDEKRNVVAKSLKFTQDASKSTERTNNATCGNCQFYKKAGEVDGVSVGTCTMISGGYVKATGWCTAWALNPSIFKK